MTKKQKKKKKVYRTATHPCGEAVLWSVWRDLWNLNFLRVKLRFLKLDFLASPKKDASNYEIKRM